MICREYYFVNEIEDRCSLDFNYWNLDLQDILCENPFFFDEYLCDGAVFIGPYLNLLIKQLKSVSGVNRRKTIINKNLSSYLTYEFECDVSEIGDLIRKHMFQEKDYGDFLEKTQKNNVFWKYVKYSIVSDRCILYYYKASANNLDIYITRECNRNSGIVWSCVKI